MGILLSVAGFWPIGREREGAGIPSGSLVPVPNSRFRIPKCRIRRYAGSSFAKLASSFFVPPELNFTVTL